MAKVSPLQKAKEAWSTQDPGEAKFTGDGCVGSRFNPVRPDGKSVMLQLRQAPPVPLVFNQYGELVPAKKKHKPIHVKVRRAEEPPKSKGLFSCFGCGK